MKKEEMAAKTREFLTPFETENLVTFFKELSVKTIFENPWILGILVVVLFYAVIRRSKFVLLFLFSLLSVALLVRYTLPSGGAVSVYSFLPFAGGALCIGAVLIYFIFLKTE